MTTLEELLTDKDFLLHWKEVWPKLRLALIEKQFQMPETVGKGGPEEVGRRTLYLKELISDLGKLAKHEVDPLKAATHKPLNRKHLS